MWQVRGAQATLLRVVHADYALPLLEALREASCKRAVVRFMASRSKGAMSCATAQGLGCEDTVSAVLCT